MQNSKLRIEKTIFAKRKSHKFNEVLFKKIMVNEINQHLQHNENIVFDKILKPIKNDDGSITYPIIFKFK